MSKKKPIIAISGCLLGEKIRYNGKDKQHSSLNSDFKDKFEVLSFCPEVEMGLGIPRAPIQLMTLDSKTNLVDVENPKINHTELAQRTFEKMIPKLKEVCGIILTTRSPSCGYNPVDVFNEKQDLIGKLEKGLWANFLEERLPLVPKIDSSDLDDDNIRNNFFKLVEQFYKDSKN